MSWRRNIYRRNIIERFGQETGLPLFEKKGVSKPIQEPVKSRFENAPKAEYLATDTRRLGHIAVTHDTVALNKRQKAVFDVLKKVANPEDMDVEYRLGVDYKLTGASNREVAEYLGWDAHRVVGRMFELREYGEVVPVEKRVCLITGFLCQSWKIKRYD